MAARTTKPGGPAVDFSLLVEQGLRLMRVLALETSTHRGSVALVEDDRLVMHRFHNVPNRHAETMLGLVQEAVDEAGWQTSTIDRVAAGIGPGAFTGIRVGLSVAAGLAIGLAIEGVGVGSLRALAYGQPEGDDRLRVILRDARRDEYFLAAYESDGSEVVAPVAIPQEGAASYLRTTFGSRDFILLGDSGLAVGSAPSGDLPSDDPDATALGRLARRLDPADHPLTPHYVRGAGALRPELPSSPLDGPRV